MYTKRNIPTMNHDLKIILNEIDRLASGDYSPVDEGLFSNRICADKLNNLVNSLKENNNDYIMRLNSVLGDLADFTIIKNMMLQQMTVLQGYILHQPVIFSLLL